ncbi:MAG: hypothetical protein D6814_17230 [Calditrichaeota bacterium]|nr:MAG: hypothetical protein D6814_17230 [Calditrichota bacterium]
MTGHKFPLVNQSDLRLSFSNRYSGFKNTPRKGAIPFPWFFALLPAPENAIFHIDIPCVNSFTRPPHINTTYS